MEQSLSSYLGLVRTYATVGALFFSAAMAVQSASFYPSIALTTLLFSTWLVIRVSSAVNRRRRLMLSGPQRVLNQADEPSEEGKRSLVDLQIAVMREHERWLVKTYGLIRRSVCVEASAAQREAAAEQERREPREVMPMRT